MSSIIEWAEPVSKSRSIPGRKSTYGEALSALRSTPGQWARVSDDLGGTKAASHAARIRNGIVVDVEPGEFEAADDNGCLFVKFVGEAGVQAYAESKAARDSKKAKRDAKAAEKAAATPADDAPGDHEAVELDGTAAVNVFDGEIADESAASGKEFGW